MKTKAITEVKVNRRFTPRETMCTPSIQTQRLFIQEKIIFQVVGEDEVSLRSIGVSQLTEAEVEIERTGMRREPEINRAGMKRLKKERKIQRTRKVITNKAVDIIGERVNLDSPKLTCLTKMTRVTSTKWQSWRKACRNSSRTAPRLNCRKIKETFCSKRFKKDCWSVRSVSTE